MVQSVDCEKRDVCGMHKEESFGASLIPTRDDILAELKQTPIKVLDKGFVQLVDVMGTDESVVEAARVSYDPTGGSSRQVSTDENLIRYLMRHSHSTPAEMCVIKLMIKCPIHVFRQWIRHRNSSTNEYSQRYSIAIDDMHETRPLAWRLQSKSNKQGSDGFLTGWPDEKQIEDYTSPGDYLSARESTLQQFAKEIYEERLAFGVAKEQARKDLPLSNYTSAFWKIDLHNLFHFLKLRMDPHAQLEIRQYADIIGRQIVAPLFPLCWRAFEDFVLNSLTLSRLDQTVIQNLVELLEEPPYPLEVFNEAAYKVKQWCSVTGPLKSCRERDECLEKLQKIGLVVNS